MNLTVRPKEPDDDPHQRAAHRATLRKIHALVKNHLRSLYQGAGELEPSRGAPWTPDYAASTAGITSPAVSRSHRRTWHNASADDGDGHDRQFPIPSAWSASRNGRSTDSCAHLEANARRSPAMVEAQATSVGAPRSVQR